MLKELELSRVRVRDDFWTPRLEANRKSGIPHNMAWCERTNRLANFEKVAAGEKSGHEGWFFNDSDVYKVLEGAAYSLVHHRDADLEAKLDKWIEIIVAAQQQDGYLNTYFCLNPDKQRWTEDQYHELYCAGNLFEAAVAYRQATGKTRLLEAALRNADHICSVFGANGRHVAPEHPEIEMALIRLWRETGDKKYFELSKFFLDQRGRHETRAPWKNYAQDHAPISEQTEIVGHAVRAMYMLAAVTDVVGVEDNPGYRKALDTIWTDLTARKLYITGGTGVWGFDEGFAPPYDLPNERSYAETCASIALAFWAERMARLHGDAQYADMLEHVMFNGVLAGVALDCTKYLYANPLASRGVKGFATSGGAQGESKQHRQEWFRCSCCPPNVVRFLASLPTLIYAYDDASVCVNLLVGGEATIPLKSGDVTLTQETRYPWDGKATLTVRAATPTPFDLKLRIPAWCEDARVFVGGTPIANPTIERGYAVLSRTWRDGDVVTLELPMPVRRIQSHPRVHANAGRVALQRGPMVYCIETADNADGVYNLALPRNAALEATHESQLLGGVTVIRGQALRRTETSEGAALYQPTPAQPLATRAVTLTATPYYAWDNRTPGEMIVWIPEQPELAE